MLNDGISRLSGETHKTIFLDAGSGPVMVADPALLFGAEFVRLGKDLLLRNADGADVRVVDYFAQEVLPDLTVPDGATLRASVVERLAGPEAPGQHAQAGGADEAGVPIGQVEQVAGTARVQRVDGTTEDLTSASKIFLGDVVQTVGQGTLSITFVDGTIFTLSADSRMVIDELIYSPASTDNSATFSLVQGGFVFIAGQVAKTGGMDVNTPAATMGIRGTTVLADVQTNAGVSTVEVTLTRDPDGSLGRVDLYDLNGNLITTITGTDTKWIVSTDDDLTREVERTSDDEASDTVLITEAISAFTTANARFSVEGRFVDLDSLARPEIEAEPDVSTGTDEAEEEQIELDSQDSEEVPEPDLAPPVEDTQGETESFDEGRLDPIPDPEGPLDDAELDVVVTALEDVPEEEVTGQLLEDISAEVSFDLVAPPSHGQVELTRDGAFRYVPEANFNGEDRFSYQVGDGSGGIETGTVTINVLPVNDAPEIEDASLSVVEDEVLLARSEAQDIDSEELTYSLLTGAQSGTVVVTETGDWSYRPNQDFDGVDSFEIRVADSDGASAAQRVTITVEGTDDAPVIVVEGSATRGTLSGGRLSASGRLEAFDPDTGASLSWTGSAEGEFGTFEIDPEGFWTFEAGDGAKAMAEGDEATESFVATVTDNDGATASEEVVLSLIGVNDGPVIVEEVSAPVVLSEGSTPEASGQIKAEDIDTGAVLEWRGSEEGTVGSFRIAADGRWSYRLNAAARNLAEGETVTETFTATVEDEYGATASEEVVITVTGSNDAPVVDSEIAQADVVENDTPVASGTLTASDADDGAVLQWSGSADGSFGRFEIGLSGDWTFELNAAAEALNADETVTERFEATVTDDQGASDTQDVVITVTGTNDAPVVGLEIVQETVTENDQPSAVGKLTASDVDADAVLTWSGSDAGAVGQFSVSADGTWSYVLTNAAEALTAGEELVERFTAVVSDEAGAQASTEVVITITGTNDAPIVASQTTEAAVTEDSAPSASGVLSASDADAGAVLQWSGSAAGSLGQFDVSAEGDWTYVLGQGAQALAAGETVTERFTAKVTDDQGATDTQDVVITITGTNDAPVVDSQVTQVSVEENDQPSAAGRLTASDADTGAVLTWSGSEDGALGRFDISANGVWSYALGSAAEALAAGQTVTERFTANVTDEAGDSDTHEVVITVTGTNDAPIVDSDVSLASVVENFAPVASGVLVASDVDVGAELSWSGSAEGAFGRFDIDNNGNWTYILNVAAEALGADVSVTERFTATVSDGQGGSDSQEVAITVTGTNDAPVAELVDFDMVSGDVLEGRLTATDADAGDTLTFAHGDTLPEHGTLILGPDGAFSYTPADGFAGKDTFSFTVTDGAGAQITSQATVWVDSAPVEGQSGSTASLTITPAGGGTVVATTTEPDAVPTSIVIALQSLGYAASTDWAGFADAIGVALGSLADQFDGAANPPQVSLISLASDTPVTESFELTDPALLARLSDLPQITESSTWADSFGAVEEFVAPQAEGTQSFVFFVADGLAQNDDWIPIFTELSEAQGEDLTARVFIVGRGPSGGTLSPAERAFTEAFLTDNIQATFDGSPVFAPTLVDLSVELIADGIDKGEIADESDIIVGADGLVSMVSLAALPDLMDKLGADNRIVVSAGFDIDGTPDSIEHQLFSSQEFGKFAQSVTETGGSEADLMFGSDLADVLSGEAGDDLLLGFGGDDLLRGMGGDDVIAVGSGRNQVEAGDGDDRIVVNTLEGAAGSDLQGGVGYDTVALAAGLDLGGFSADDALINLSGVEAIDLTNSADNTLTLSVDDVLSISGDADAELEGLLGKEVLSSLTLVGDVGDRLELLDSDTGTFTPTGLTLESADGTVLDVYTFVDGGNVHAALAVDSDITVVTATATA